MNTADLALFVRTADIGSITASAQQLDMTPAAASAALKRLEKQLGVQLFVRSTRQLRITTEGERFLLYCRQALTALEDGKASLNAMSGKIAGTVRLSVTSDLGRNRVLPWLDEAMEEHPELSINLITSDSRLDFYLDRIDVALRMGEPEDSSMVAFHIVSFDRIACASPAYLDQHSTPKHPDDLQQHNCLIYQLRDLSYDLWTLYSDTETYKVKIKGNRASNDGDVVRRWVVSGKGIAFKSRLDMTADLNAGNVVQVLSDYRSDPISLWLTCPSRKQVTPAVLILRDWLREKCAAALKTAR
jgi:DNA-binding transcriptional LysR family regulator